MAVETLTAIAVGKVADLVVGELVHGAVEALLARRMRAAREVLQKRMAEGAVWAWSEDDLASALFTYMRAAQEGAARLNLRLMADALCTGAAEPTFAPDELRRHSRQLSELSRDEVLILVAMIQAENTPQEDGQSLTPGWRVAGEPQRFGLPESVDAYAGLEALTRTGWVVSHSVLGGTAYEFSRNFAPVRRLVDFELALRTFNPGA